MIVSRLMGGLGNQLFQYAAGRALAKANNELLALDTRYVEENGLEHFSHAYLSPPKHLPPSKNSNPIKYWAWRHLGFGIPLFRESGRKYDANLFNCPEGTYIQGYWHSYKYAEKVKSELEKELMLTTPLDNVNKKMADTIKENDNAVSLHIRRGDYLSFGIFNLLDMEYYKEAIYEICQRTSKPITCFVFSNDISWARDNLNIECDTVYVDINGADKGHLDLHLMSLCSHNVIANSTFSWWGAWLNQNPNKLVITPKKWFNQNSLEHDDICPPSWQRL